MKVKVIKEFKDRYSGRLYKAGEIITVSKYRFEEILKVGKFVEEVKEPKEAKKKENTAE